MTNDASTIKTPRIASTDTVPHSNRNSIINIASANLPSLNEITPIQPSHHLNSTFREIALTLVKRLFGCLGNLNSIKDPYIHKRVLEFVFTKWERLAKIKDDLRLKDLTQIVMPASYFSPWLFEAIYQLPYNYQSGKLIAYKTLCHIMIRSTQVVNYLMLGGSSNDFDAISDEFIDLFYLTVHQGLISSDKVKY